MAYILKKIAEFSNTEKKAFQVLMESLNISIKEAQRLIDKKRLFANKKVVQKKNAMIKGLIELLDYETQAKGVEILFENEDFAILEKASGILSHPNGRNCTYSLSDEIWHLWGKKACVAHRLDKETSGLILVAKSPQTAQKLKKMFEQRQIYKEYLALVSGKTAKKFQVNAAMALNKNYDDFKMRMQICSLKEEGKEAVSEFEQLEYFEKLNTSLVLCKPHTGRQHQLRLHLFHIKHKILGESLYGLEKKDIEALLDKKLNEKQRIKLTGAKRLCLHSLRLSFEFKGKNFDFYSKKQIKEEFLQSLV